MEIIATHPHSRDTSQRSLWFGIGAAAAAWVLHGFIWEMVTSQACQDGDGDWGPISATGVAWLLGGVTIVLLGVAVLGGLTAFRNWRSLSEDPDLAHAEAPGRKQFMALFGVVVSLLFTIGIIWAGLPLFLMDVCVKAR